MSYISFDYKCRDCGNIEARMVKREHMDFQLCGCTGPNQITLGPMVALPPATRTTFRFADTKLKD